MATDQIKRCPKCGQPKPADAFSRKHAGCRDCRRAHFQEWIKNKPPGYDLQRQRKWRSDNRQHHADYNKAWYHRHKERVSIKLKAYREKNREVVRARKRDYHNRNSKVITAKVAAWRKANPHLKRASDMRREARKLSLPHDWTGADLQFGLAYWNHCCAACGSSLKANKRHWDHWIPLNCSACPGTVPGNMLPLCERCNTTKHDEPADEWLARKFGKRDAARIARAVVRFFGKIRHVPAGA